MNTLVIVIIAVVLALCIGFAIGQTIHCGSRNSSDIMNSNDTHAVEVGYESKERGGQATQMLTDDIKAYGIYTFTPGNVIVHTGNMRPTETEYARQLEVYCWKCGNQSYMKCGVECSKVTDGWVATAERDSRLRTVLHENLIHYTLILGMDNWVLPGCLIGLILTFLEQIGHALVYTILSGIVDGRVVTAISHTKLDVWPACEASDGAECFTCSSVGYQVDDTNLIRGCKFVAQQLHELSNQMLSQPHATPDLGKMPNPTVPEAHQNNLMERLNIITKYAEAAAKIWMTLMTNIKNDDAIDILTETRLENWPHVWAAVAAGMDNNLEEDQTYLNWLGNAVLHGKYDNLPEMSFSQNGAVNLLNVNMPNPIIKLQEADVTLENVQLLMNSNKEACIPQTWLNPILELMSARVETMNNLPNPPPQTLAEIAIVCCACLNTLIAVIDNKTASDEDVKTFYCRCLDAMTFIVNNTSMDKLRNGRSSLGKFAKPSAKMLLQIHARYKGNIIFNELQRGTFAKLQIL